MCLQRPDRKYIALEWNLPIELTVQLSSEALVPLLLWLRPRSAHHHLCVIHK